MLLAIVSEVSGSLALKAGAGAPRFYAVTLLGYLTAFAALSYALRAGLPLGLVYGVWAASGVALTAIASYVIFAEPFSWRMGFGIALIAAGVLLVESSSQKVEP